MPVRKTESRIPQGFAASDLGEASVAADARCALVSFITSPLCTGRENAYVVFVTDSGLAASAQSFEWSFSENGGPPVIQSTPIGEIFYSPKTVGSLSVAVRILDSGNTEQASLALDQTISSLNADLEAFIASASDQPGPGASDPEASRELVNNHLLYLDAVTPPPSETDDSFKQFVFGMVMGSVIMSTPADRQQVIEDIAQTLNNSDTDGFAEGTEQGVGVCRIRLALLAMAPPAGMAALPWTELPQAASQNAYADEKLRQSLAALDEHTRIDLFNLARFPKAAISQCARLSVALRDHYFAGANFNDVLTGMSGTRSTWIIKHYGEGPLST